MMASQATVYKIGMLKILELADRYGRFIFPERARPDWPALRESGPSPDCLGGGPRWDATARAAYRLPSFVLQSSNSGSWRIALASRISRLGFADIAHEAPAVWAAFFCG